MKISIIGLGYVGLPLAVEFSKLYETVGYDVNAKRVSEIKASEDINGDIEQEILSNLHQIFQLILKYLLKHFVT